MPLFDIYANVTIRESGGRVVGPLCIQGNGGAVRWVERRRVDRDVEQASAGKPLSIYEPAPGCALGFLPLTTTRDDDRRTVIDLRDATVVAWEQRPR